MIKVSQKIYIQLMVLCSLFLNKGLANEPDTVYLFSYVTEKRDFKNGLHFAWSIDQESWHPIGPEFRFLTSDFGNWSTQKKMINPFLFQDSLKTWHCFWTLDEEVGQLAYASSRDLYTWGRQSYPVMMENGNLLDIEVQYQLSNNNYVISWISNQGPKQGIFKVHSSDLKTFSSTSEGSAIERFARDTVRINGVEQLGQIHKASWSTVDGLIKYYEWSQFHEQERQERLRDIEHLEDLEVVQATVSIEPEKSKPISDLLMGIFFEDINYAADGGLYAELIQNRGFEYDPFEKNGRDPLWNSRTAWIFSGNPDQFVIDTTEPVHQNQKHYASIRIDQVGPTLQNTGYGGISVKKGERYDFSFWARKKDHNLGQLNIQLANADQRILAESQIHINQDGWYQYQVTLIANSTDHQAHLEIEPTQSGTYDLDMISLFPQNTFRGRKNGLRKDLAQIIADINPRFIRFPGGCVAHGNGIDNIYRWKQTVGPLETRKPMKNIWRYHQSMGLGYYEYFQFCEDLGAEPIPVLAAGVPCQNSSDGGHGQQCGIPIEDMDEYIQDVLDLIEWANGDQNTKWGKVRALAGHPEPFDLKYIGIGNEDLITDIFEERFRMIYEAVQKKYPDIVVIGTVGPFYRGTDYREGWALARALEIPIVDEHYYQPAGWFINNQDFYDRYDRSSSKVYLGEYATHLPNRKMNLETALCEAIYLSSIERNGDVVQMTSFAPLLAKEGFTQWNPDLIYFNNYEVKPTVDYYVQKMYGQNAGNEYIPSTIHLSNSHPDVANRIAVSVVRDESTKDYIFKLSNLLPVPVKSNIDLSECDELLPEAMAMVLTGDPADEDIRPTTSTLKIDKNLSYILPPYSFSVIRIQPK